MTDDTKRPAAEPSHAEEPGPVAGEATDSGERTVDASADDVATGAGAPVTDERGDDVAVGADVPAPDTATGPAGESPRPEDAAAGTGSEAVSEPEGGVPPADQRGGTFTWHPDHRGKTVDEVRSSLAQEIASDQRQHRLAMDGAEESEQDALTSVVNLERKWGQYDFDWVEQDPEELADRITRFERERERRRVMLTWADYRDEQLDAGGMGDMGERPAELSTGTKALALLLVVLLIVVILLAVWAL